MCLNMSGIGWLIASFSGVFHHGTSVLKSWKKIFRCLVVFVVPSFVVVHCCGDDGGVSVRPSDHHLFFLCLITFSVSVCCHCRHMTILCIHLICKLCRRACRYHVSGRPIVLSSKEKKKKPWASLKTHAPALHSLSKRLAVVSIVNALLLHAFSSCGLQSSWFKVYGLEHLTWVPEFMRGQSPFSLYLCVYVCTRLCFIPGSMIAVLTLGRNNVMIPSASFYAFFIGHLWLANRSVLVIL